ncbi:phage major tail protein, TP901-1 family [Polycladidibacter hongkongensis]|uniref:phage major tail protein, TP901-1 family n=1 Tax=Polycladidibacter hongkongensis TaxID=1647556 RepID=UPI0008319BFE|nr:phage major tail protein, TP901-1 family [Pseudovibrio hongkongensis]
MSAQTGRDLLLKIDATGTGAFVSVAGLRSKKLALSATAPDITDTASPQRWRELLSAAGTRALSLSGRGIIKDSESDKLLQQVFFAAKLCTWQIIVPALGHLEGQFHLQALEYAGEFNRELTYEIALESAGLITFTEEVRTGEDSQ